MKFNDEIEAWRQRATQMRIPFMCNGKDVTEHWECYQLEREEIDAAVALMRRHDDRLTRLREWAENCAHVECEHGDMVPDSLYHSSLMNKIAELLAETKETD